MNTEHELFGELHEQEEAGLFGNEHRRQYEAQQEALRLSAIMPSLHSEPKNKDDMLLEILAPLGTEIPDPTGGYADLFAYLYDKISPLLSNEA
jgi:hypothetical protein